MLSRPQNQKVHDLLTLNLTGGHKPNATAVSTAGILTVLQQKFPIAARPDEKAERNPIIPEKGMKPTQWPKWRNGKLGAFRTLIPDGCSHNWSVPSLQGELDTNHTKMLEGWTWMNHQSFTQKQPFSNKRRLHRAQTICITRVTSPKYNELGIDMSAYERMDGHGVDRCKFLNDRCN